MVTKTQAIKNFLNLVALPDLAALYTPDMECQVNVAEDGGTLVPGEFRGRRYRAWTDGETTWKPFRIPFNAKSKPEFHDSELRFDLARHAEGIGMTGWDWKNLCSRWVAFDFDAITGHADSHQKKLTPEELAEVTKRATEIPWVTVRKSSSGSGLHLYVFLKPVPTKNHTEHAALARSILGQMSLLAEFDFNSKVDACGVNIWVWHRKAEGTDGFTLVKQGEILEEPPANWQDHIKVASRKSRKTLPKFIENSEQSEEDILFQELTGQCDRIPLDSGHQALLAWLNENKYIAWWDADNHMLIAHTAALKLAYGELGLAGIFDTMAEGSDLHNDYNCFLFPLRRGGWVVRRFTRGVAEKPCWDQDNTGWTRCYFNKEPDLRSASRMRGGVESEKGGFSFRHADDAMKVANDLGANINIPPSALARPAELKKHKDGRLIMVLPKENHDSYDTFQSWLDDKSKWTQIFDTKVESTTELETYQYDDVVRHVISTNGEDCGWMVQGEGRWRKEPLNHTQLALEALGLKTSDVKSIIGSSVFKAWTLVNKPFDVEYPGNREWNKNAAQFKYEIKQETENLHYPTWKKLLEHIGEQLDEALSENTWAKANGIITGADYLKCWIASLFQYPMRPLPYLFLYGPQNSGKSSLHEALALLVTAGYVRADNALTSTSGFNGELANAVICVVEETDLRQNKQAYNKIKDWVTSPMLPIRAMYQTTYLTTNTTHWIQCANDAAACPIFDGDTRITMIFVDSLSPTALIPKGKMFEQLITEASDFLTEMVNLEIPESPDRLNVPVIQTEDKIQAGKLRQNIVEQFIDEQCYIVHGYMTRFSDFYAAFEAWAPPTVLQENWTKPKVARAIPTKTPKGRSHSDNQVYVGNLLLEEPPEDLEELPRLVLRGTHLKHVEQSSPNADG